MRPRITEPPARRSRPGARWGRHDVAVAAVPAQPRRVRNLLRLAIEMAAPPLVLVGRRAPGPDKKMRPVPSADRDWPGRAVLTAPSGTVRSSRPSLARQAHRMSGPSPGSRWPPAQPATSSRSVQDRVAGNVLPRGRHRVSSRGGAADPIARARTLPSLETAGPPQAGRPPGIPASPAPHTGARPLPSR